MNVHFLKWPSRMSFMPAVGRNSLRDYSIICASITTRILFSVWQFSTRLMRTLTPSVHHGTPGRHSKIARHYDPRRHGHSGDHNTARRRVFEFPEASSPNSKSSYRNLQVSAAPDIVLRLKARCPGPLPYPWQWFSDDVLCVIPTLRDRNKRSPGLWEFRLNNHKRRIHQSFYRNRQHPVHRPSFPFH